ncbi:MAG: hypothetical protein HYY06_06420 [Deltaproteobacteria bacterium]|nr:hypothetical protein [Deltaproteobacteria bacterium]
MPATTSPFFTPHGFQGHSGGNRFEPIIDAAAYFSEIYRRICAARVSVSVAGYDLDWRIPLVRGQAGGETTLRNALQIAARRARCRVLVWAPSFAQHVLGTVGWKVWDDARANPIRGVELLLASTSAVWSSHHQKCVIVDSSVAWVGGIDIARDRWDTDRHDAAAPRDGDYGPVHDVQGRVEGPAVWDVEYNFGQRWLVAEREKPYFLDPDGESHEHASMIAAGQRAARGPGARPGKARRLYRRPGGHRVQVVRTMPWLGEQGVRDMTARAFGQAKRLVYIENQYAFQSGWATRQARLALQRERDLRMVVVMPLWPDLLPFPMPGLPDRLDMRENLGSLFTDFGDRVAIVGLLANGAAPGRYAPIYCHSKVMIVDDVWLTVGSANLDDGSLESSTELNLSVLDDSSARNLREALLGEHLEGMFDQSAVDDPAALLRLIRSAAQDSAHRVAAREKLRSRVYEYFWDRRAMPEPPRP